MQELYLVHSVIALAFTYKADRWVLKHACSAKRLSEAGAVAQMKQYADDHGLGWPVDGILFYVRDASRAAQPQAQKHEVVV